MTQKQYKPSYLHLKNKWSDRKAQIEKSLVERHQESIDWLHHTTKHMMVGAAASVLMLSHPATTTVLAQTFQPKQDQPVKVATVHTREQLVSDLKTLLPAGIDVLTPEQDQAVAQKLQEYFHLATAPELEGKRLDRTYGIIGAEQHLMRYPGDTIDTHFATPEEAKYISSGMAPGRGAWGYFAPSAAEMTQKDVEREKYYLAVQTFLAPGWKDDVNGHYKFFKHRKMIIVNPENGKGMVVVIGDAGPAPFTGKHLGGSPEVMSYLERQDGGAKGPVLYYFINDPNDSVPLGPIEIQ
ncbi:MAG: hypothetical protein ACEQSA_03800 [Weeksellaceae bacterium]